MFVLFFDFNWKANRVNNRQRDFSLCLCLNLSLPNACHNSVTGLKGVLLIFSKCYLKIESSLLILSKHHTS